MKDPCKIGLRGLIPSLHTPFLDNNELDQRSIEKIIDHVIRNNCAGMLIGAVAGEGESLSIEEKNRFFKLASEYNNNKIPIIISCTAKKQSDRLKIAKIAQESGVDWMLCQIPAFDNVENLVSKLMEIEQIGPKYLMLQDLSWDDNGIDISIIKHLFKKIKKFKSLKIEVINSGEKYSKVLKETKGKLHVSGGWAIIEMIDALDRGVHGLMPSTLEEVFVKIYNLYINDQKKEAISLFNKLLPILRFTHQHLNISIHFAKLLRVKENIFSSSHSRLPKKSLKDFPLQEAKIILNKALDLKTTYKEY